MVKTPSQNSSFFYTHKLALIAFIAGYIALFLPTTYVQVSILNPPIVPSQMQTGYWLRFSQNTPDSVDSLGTCRISYIIWTSDLQKWLLNGWLTLCRIGFIVLISATMHYIAFYKMPGANFLVLALLLFVGPLLLFLGISRMGPMEYFCEPTPEVQVQYFIPLFPIALLPHIGSVLIFRKLGKLQAPTTTTQNEHTQQSPTP